MKISMIIPTRGRVSYLKRCIESIENQTEFPYELIVILHEHDIDSKEFIKNISTKLNIKYIETNGGNCKSRNVGIDYSSGDILAFIDDDDILEENYIKNLSMIFKENKINVVAGYTFDIGVLITPWYMSKDELEYIYNRRDNKFYQLIIEEISKRSLGKIKLDLKYIKGKKLKVYGLLKNIRDLFKSMIIQEWPIKGKILPSGYRSAFYNITELKELKKIEWVAGNNFAVRKNIIDKFRFNEKMELLPYALCEDLELSARIGKEYEIFSSPDILVFHLSSPLGIRINQRERFKSMIVNYYRIAIIRGNKVAYWWSVIGLLVTRIFKVPFSYSVAISEIKGILDGIKYLKENDLNDAIAT
ncbi:glycosyltransferase family 2 protein [Methanobacterium sp.]|uniref:glycosyltransferase family 2 protein n=1 Tax=Methanobacterium sp. TaxID=2164 RepID=UPI003C712CC9